MRAAWIMVAALSTLAATPAGAQLAAPEARTPAGGAAASLAALLAELPPDSRAGDRLAEGVRTSWTEDGALDYLGAPAGRAFSAPAGPPGQPEAAAIAFLKSHRPLFGIEDEAVDFKPLRIRAAKERVYVRLQQTIADVPVFGGEMVVQVTPGGAIEAVLGNIARGPAPRPESARLLPDAASAAEAARRLALSRGGVSAEFGAGEPKKSWFVPSVLREPGTPRLVWVIDVSDPRLHVSSARWLIDAGDGSLLREYPRVYDALARQIRDMNSDTLSTPAPIVRTEGGPPSGVADADASYDMLGDTDAYYRTNHGRDGIDDAGLLNVATVRVCTRASVPPNPQCPWPNANYNPADRQFRIGAGWAVDDVLAHEFTHGVTDHESDLIYANESGAINESLSDVWGEFVDLGNARGNDASAVRWLVGEDLAGGAIRSMRDPTSVCRPTCSPDRFGSTLYVPPVATPTAANDWGGVHFNSGVNNKLCYLLTDGDAFNGQTIVGLGSVSVATLYYEVQTGLLVSSSGWAWLSDALLQAAINLGWSAADQNNVYRACQAVEIAQPTRIQYVAASIPCATETGLPTCSILTGGPYRTVGAAVAGSRPGDTLRFLNGGNYPGGISITKQLILDAESGAVTLGQ